MLNFDTEYFLRNSQRQISLIVIGNQKFQRRSEFGSIVANIHHLCFQKFCSVFHRFQAQWKTKSPTDVSFFKNVLQIIRGTRALQKMWGDRGLLHNCIFLFQEENGLHGKKWKHRISLEMCQQFSSFFHDVFGKIVGY